MRTLLKSSWLALVGVALILVGVVLAVATGDSDVPNDPNIGAGVLATAGVVILASALLVKVLDR